MGCDCDGVLSMCAGEGVLCDGVIVMVCFRCVPVRVCCVKVCL